MTGVRLVQYGVRHMGIMHSQRGEADGRTEWQRIRNWSGEVF